MFGKVDEVPGLFHVATRFGHVNYVPLAPSQSFVVLNMPVEGGTRGAFRGVPIRMSRKSVIVAWLRAVAVVGELVALGFAIYAWCDHRDASIPLVLAAMAAIVAYFAFTSRLLRMASYERAIELGQLIGLNQRGLAEIAKRYGKEAPPETSEPIAAESAEEAPATSTFFVTGRDTARQQDVCVTVWAKDEQEAKAIAIGRGIEVQVVEAGSR